jgi:hypothetical protein
MKAILVRAIGRGPELHAADSGGRGYVHQRERVNDVHTAPRAAGFRLPFAKARVHRNDGAVEARGRHLQHPCLSVPYVSPEPVLATHRFSGTVEKNKGVSHLDIVCRHVSNERLSKVRKDCVVARGCCCVTQGLCRRGCIRNTEQRACLLDKDMP